MVNATPEYRNAVEAYLAAAERVNRLATDLSTDDAEFRDAVNELSRLSLRLQTMRTEEGKARKPEPLA